MGRKVLIAFMLGTIWSALAYNNPFTSHAADTSMHEFGAAADFGSPSNERIAGIVSTASGGGYWVAAISGSVYSYGDAVFHGTARSTSPFVGISRTASGNGYWLTSADGGVFSYGDAVFYGSAGGAPLQQPIVEMIVTSSGRGYWLIGSDGGVFSYGDAVFYGSAGGVPLSKPIISAARTTSGKGYWLLATDGGVFSFGDAVYRGSAFGATTQAIIAMSVSSSGDGYRLVATDGGVFTFGDARYYGSAFGSVAGRAVAHASRPDDSGYWIVDSPLNKALSTRAMSAPLFAPHSVAGKRVVYSVSMQRVWHVEEDNVVVDSFLVSGRAGIPAPGTYSVKRRLNPGRSGSLSLDYFVGFAYGRRTDIGFHGIPRTSRGAFIQTEAELGQYRSHGCVRQALSDARLTWDFAPTGTAVVVLP